MTTIAWDGETLAADGRLCSSSGVLLSDSKNKIVKIKDNKKRKWHIAVSGNEPDITYLKNALSGTNIKKTLLNLKQVLQDTAISDSFCAVVVSKKTQYMVFHDMSFSLLECRDAFGSGGEFALAAMSMGYNAIGAVRVASGLDLYTGGTIRSIQVTD